MKIFILSLVVSLALPLTLMAYPNVGDSVTYNGRYTVVREGKQLSVGFIQVLTLNSFKKDSGSFELEQSIYAPDGSLKESKSDVPLADLKNSELMQSVLENCVDVGGTLEKIEVAAGEFDTCKMINEKKDKTVWLGDVPFSIVRQIEKDENGVSIDMELSLMTLGEEPKE